MEGCSVSDPYDPLEAYEQGKREAESALTELRARVERAEAERDEWGWLWKRAENRIERAKERLAHPWSQAETDALDILSESPPTECRVCGGSGACNASIADCEACGGSGKSVTTPTRADLERERDTYWTEAMRLSAEESRLSRALREAEEALERERQLNERAFAQVNAELKKNDDVLTEEQLRELYPIQLGSLALAARPDRWAPHGDPDALAILRRAREAQGGSE
jgi:DNA repair exonuclease SbcCD ATPase subunit